MIWATSALSFSTARWAFDFLRLGGMAPNLKKEMYDEMNTITV